MSAPKLTRAIMDTMGYDPKTTVAEAQAQLEENIEKSKSFGKWTAASQEEKKK